MNDIINGLKYFGNQILEFIKKHIVIIVVIIIISITLIYGYLKIFNEAIPNNNDININTNINHREQTATE